jgi:hypothetical protein
MFPGLANFKHGPKVSGRRFPPFGANVFISMSESFASLYVREAKFKPTIIVKAKKKLMNLRQIVLTTFSLSDLILTLVGSLWFSFRCS